jgi:hypothetical protein
MSFLFAAPDPLATAASDLAGIGSTLGTANAAAAASTTGVAAAAADQVSAQVAALLSEHGLGYQQISSQLAAFHDQFVQTLSAGASSYAAAEANAAQTLTNAVNAPAAAMLGQPLIGGGVSAGAAGGSVASAGGVVSNALGRIETALGFNFPGAAGLTGGSNFLGGSSLLGGVAPGGVVSSALGRVESVVLGNGAAGLLGSSFLGGSGLLGGVAQEIGAASQASALLLGPTGGIKALTAASALLAPAAMTNTAAVPAANGAIANGIENAYLVIEPYVRYGFQLAAYAVGFVPWVGFLAPQILYVYDLIEPIVQSGLFNTLDWLSGSISFSQGVSQFVAATTASINQFIYTEIHYFLPPLPPLPGIFG